MELSKAEITRIEELCYAHLLDEDEEARLEGFSCSSRVLNEPIPDIGQQLFDLPVAEPGALDASRGADALDSGDAAQAGQAFRRDPSDRPPSALELVDLGDQRQDFRGDLERRGVERHAIDSSVYTQLP